LPTYNFLPMVGLPEKEHGTRPPRRGGSAPGIASRMGPGKVGWKCEDDQGTAARPNERGLCMGRLGGRPGEMPDGGHGGLRSY
jgi:hypothetical protein